MKILRNFKEIEWRSIVNFAFMNLGLWVIFCVAFFLKTPEDDPGFWGYLYIFCNTLGHFGVFSLGLMLILAIFSWIGCKSYRIAAILLGSLFIFYLFSDFIVYTQYKFHINMQILGLFISPAGMELVTFPWSMKIGVALIILFICGVEFYLLKFSSKFTVWKSWIALSSAILVAFLAFNTIFAVANFFGNSRILILSEALPLGYELNANNLFDALGWKGDVKYETQGENDGNFNYPLADLEFKKLDNPYNIIFLFIDGLRADMVQEDIMPNLTKFANENILFTNHYSAGNCTRTGIFSAFYGISGVYWHHALRAQRQSGFISALLEQNYAVKSFASATLRSPEFHQTVFKDVPNLRLDAEGRFKYERDLSSIEEFKAFLKTHNKNTPYFGFLFLDSLHGNEIPFGYPNKYQPAFTTINYLTLTANDDDSKVKMRNLVKNASNYVDSVVGKLLEDLKASGELENTILVITADHANAINENNDNSWGHNGDFSSYQTQVPLIIMLPEKRQEVITYRTNHTDIVPTFLSQYLGCKNPISDYSTGVNLFDSSGRDNSYILMSNYGKKAIFYKDNLFELTNYGTIKTYDLTGKKNKASLPKEIFEKSFKEMRKFIQ